MTTISSQQAMQNRMVAQAGNIDVGIGDGMGAAVGDTWRAGPTAALIRAADSIFDTSDKITADEANKMYGLHGTEAEFKFDEDLTRDAAKARAADFHEIRMNQIIKETVNEESPIMGNVTQFAASMATSLVDPVLVAANVAGAGLVGNAAKALTTSARTFNGIAKASPFAAKSLLAAYADDGVKSLMTVVAREGLENFAGGLIEESIIQNIGIGDERLARKTTWKDSMQNIVAGTVMGTAFGTILSKDGRKAIADGYLFDWGDDAAEFVKANSIISSLEAGAGHEKGRLEMALMNRQRFGTRPWYNVQEAAFVPNSTPAKRVFIPIDENGAAHTFSNRGPGTVLTGSQSHAMNTGTKVIEVHTDKLKLATADVIVQNGKHSKIGSQLAKDMVEGMVHNTDTINLARTIAILKDPDVDLSTVAAMPFKEAKAELSAMLDGKNLDEMVDIMNGVRSRSESNFKVDAVIEKTLDAAGFNGYTFNGKDFDGKPAYQGVYVSQKYTDRIRRQATIDVPPPSAGDKVKWQFEQEQLYRKHKDWVKKEAKPLKSGIEEIKEMVGLPKDTPLDTPPKKLNEHGEALASSKEKVSVLTKAKDVLKAEIEELKLAGKDIDPDMEKNIEIMEMIEQGMDQKKLVDTDLESWGKFADCIMKGMA